MKALHVFEKANLGKAPFTCIDAYDEGQRDYSKAQYHSSCDFCYTQIRYIFLIQSADGKKFNVGSSCVEKTGDKNLIEIVKQELKRMHYKREEVEEGSSCILFTENSIFPYGKYIGQTIKSVVKDDLDYIKYVMDNSETMIMNNTPKGQFNKFLYRYAKPTIEKLNKIIEEKKVRSNFVGTIGDRITVTATIVDKKSGEGTYGYWTLTILEDDKGNYYKYFNAIRVLNNSYCVVGDVVKFKATIKNHEIYEGRKQTTLARAGKGELLKSDYIRYTQSI